MKKYFLLIFFIAVHFFCFSQKEKPKYKYSKSKHSLKIPALSYLDFTSPSLGLGHEHILNDKVGIHHELAYTTMYFNPLYCSVNTPKMHGVKQHVDIRIYPAKGAPYFFVAPTYYFKFTNMHDEGWVDRNGGAYMQKMKYSQRKITNVVGVKIGSSINTGKKTTN